MKYNDKFLAIFFFSPLVIIFIIQGSLNINTQKPVLVVSKQKSTLNFNTNFIRLASLGNTRMLSDLLWITTLIESDLEHYKTRDLNSWMYLRFLSISSLDPKWYNVYEFGSRYLSIIKDDLVGAEKLFLKGLQHFPNSYSLNYNLGFLYAFEMNEYKKAIPYYQKIQYHPKSPQFISSLIGKIKASSGIDLEQVFIAILDLYNKEKDEKFKEKLFNDLYAIRSEIDLDCLNEKRSNCKLFDLTGKSYLKKGAFYTSRREFIPYRLRQKKRGH